MPGATPRTILVIAEGRQSALSMLGPVRLVRQMLVVVTVLMVLFLLLASSQEVNETSGDFIQLVAGMLPAPLDNGTARSGSGVGTSPE
jgi:hypothetical protein